MREKPGWLGRAQRMPIEVPSVTPAVQRVQRVMFGFVVVFAAVDLAAAWIVGHASSSVGWGFVAMVAGVLLELPIAVLLIKRFQPALATLPRSGILAMKVVPSVAVQVPPDGALPDAPPPPRP